MRESGKSGYKFSPVKKIKNVLTKTRKSEPAAPEPNLLHPEWQPRNGAKKAVPHAEKILQAAIHDGRPRPDSGIGADVIAMWQHLEGKLDVSATRSAVFAAAAARKTPMQGPIEDSDKHSAKDHVDGHTNDSVKKQDDETDTLYTVIGQSEGNNPEHKDRSVSPPRSKSPLPELDDTWWSDGANLFQNTPRASRSSENTLVMGTAPSTGSSDTGPSRPLAVRTAQQGNVKPPRTPKGNKSIDSDEGTSSTLPHIAHYLLKSEEYDA